MFFLPCYPYLFLFLPLSLSLLEFIFKLSFFYLFFSSTLRTFPCILALSDRFSVLSISHYLSISERYCVLLCFITHTLFSLLLLFSPHFITHIDLLFFVDGLSYLFWLLAFSTSLSQTEPLTIMRYLIT